jgi:hypothetical protein
MNHLRVIKYKIVLGSYIIYEILAILGVILEENTFGLLRRIKERKEKVRKKVIGKNTMEVAQNLKKI